MVVVSIMFLGGLCCSAFLLPGAVLVSKLFIVFMCKCGSLVCGKGGGRVVGERVSIRIASPRANKQAFVPIS